MMWHLVAGRVGTAGRRLIGMVVVMASVVGACSDGAAPDRRAQEDGTDGIDPSIDPPTRLGAEPSGDGPDARLEVSFAPAPGADAHALIFDDDSDPVVLTSEECTEGSCRVSFDRLSMAGVTSLAAAAVTSEGQSPPTDPIPLPVWPEADPPPELGEEEPVTLVIARAGDDRRHQGWFLNWFTLERM